MSLFLRVLCCLAAFTVLASFLAFSVVAQEYSTQYPDVYNSGSPYWVQCTIEGMGEYVIVLDPNINPQSFGFDAPTGYNLINNTGSTIYGRAYDINSYAGYNARWVSFYKLQLQNGATSYGQATWVDYNITNITGTTLDLVDHYGGRENDMYKYDLERPELLVVIALVIIVFVLVYQFHFKSRLMRM